MSVLKIGEFSQLGRVSVRMLRHYDATGLLKPAEVDHLSGYRFYAVEQLPRLNRILALKDLGLSLEQVGRHLEVEGPTCLRAAPYACHAPNRPRTGTARRSRAARAGRGAPEADRA